MSGSTRKKLLASLSALLAAIMIFATFCAPQEDKVQEALNQTKMQALFGQLLASQNISIGFGNTGGDLARVSYAGGNYTITIHNSYAGANVSVIKAFLAHELTHVKWAVNGTGALVTHNLTFAEEYDAWKTQTEVWRAHKGGLTDDQLDQKEQLIFTNGGYRNKDEVKTTLEWVGYTFGD